MNKRLAFATVVTGFSGMVVQLLLLREMLVVFHGNDLSIGIILANWLISEALGAYFIGKKIANAKRKTGWFIALSILFTFIVPVAIYCVRIIRDLLGVMPGAGLGILPIFYSSFLILFLPSLLHGILFVVTCKLFSQSKEKSDGLNPQHGATSIGKIYAWETVGHVIGAIALTLLIIPFFNSFTIVIAIGVLTVIATMFLLNFTAKPMPYRWAMGLLGSILAFYVGMLVFGVDNQIHYMTIARQWPNKEVVHYQHSLYGNVAVIYRKGEYTFVTDGLPAITTPNPDIFKVEELVHFSMLAHPHPEKIAVLGGGAGGVLGEILKYESVKKVDYTEIDPMLIELLKKFSTPLTEGELSDPRVNTLHIDGRRFLKLTDNLYDVVFVGASKPKNLEANRYFTVEFASIVKERLRDGGILVISLPGSLTYMGREMKNMNTVVINTLKSVFPYVHVIPGDNNLFMASNSGEILNTDANLLYQRLGERQIETMLITFPHLNQRLLQGWSEWFWAKINAAPTDEVNSDFRPKGFFYTLSYWNAMFSPYLSWFFLRLENLKISFFVIAIAILTGVFLILGWRFKRLQRLFVPYSIATTGFSGMAFDLILIFAFQVMFGFVYHWVGFLIAAFMVGVSVGGFVMATNVSKIKNDKLLFIKLEIGVVVFAILLPLIIQAMFPHTKNPTVFFLGQLFFLFLAFVAGSLTGIKFPLANKLHLAQYPEVGRSVGLFYGADLMGGWVGGIVVAVVLLPVLGIVGTSLVVVTVKASSVTLLSLFSKFR